MTIDTTFLALIALATMTMAVIQAAAVIYAARAAKEATRTIQRLEGELAPILANARQASEDAARLTALALTQVERVDAFVSATTARVEETVAAVQDVVMGPLKQGSAVWAGIQAALAFFTSQQGRRRSTAADHDEDDDESLFIG